MKYTHQKLLKGKVSLMEMTTSSIEVLMSDILHSLSDKDGLYKIASVNLDTSLSKGAFSFFFCCKVDEVNEWLLGLNFDNVKTIHVYEFDNYEDMVNEADNLLSCASFKSNKSLPHNNTDFWSNSTTN